MSLVPASANEKLRQEISASNITNYESIKWGVFSLDIARPASYSKDARNILRDTTSGPSTCPFIAF
jgi:hypothetical protein